MGREFTIFSLFYFVFEGKFQVQAPQGAYIRRGDLTEGFSRYDFGGLIFGRAYTWRDLFSEFYGIIVCYSIFCGGQLSTSGLFQKKSSNSPHGKESKTVLDSGFHVVESGFQVLHFSLCQWNYEPFVAWWNLDSGFLEVYSQFPCPGSRTQDSMLKICPRGELTNGRVESWLAFTSYTLYYLHLIHFMVILQ